MISATLLLGCIILLTSPYTSAETRTWTSTKGQKIEGLLLGFTSLDVTIQSNGKVYTFPLQRLSEADRVFVTNLPEDWKEKEQGETGEASSSTLFGQELEAGQRYEFLRDLSPETIETFSDHKKPATKMKIVVVFPDDYQPNRPQKVFWTSYGLNIDWEWQQGNIGMIKWIGDSLLKKGFIIIAADTEHGGPKEMNNPSQNANAPNAFQKDVLNALVEEWPDIKSWKHIAGGFSGNGKMSFSRIAQLLDSGFNVVGHFVGGCNRSHASLASDSLNLSKAPYRPVKLWVSTGTRDTVVPLRRIPAVITDCKKVGYRKIKEETYDGAHDFSFEQFAEALDWFVEED